MAKNVMQYVLLDLGVPVNLTAQQSKELFNGILKQDKTIGSLERESEELKEECERLRILFLKLNDRVKEKYNDFLINMEYPAAHFLEEVLHIIEPWKHNAGGGTRKYIDALMQIAGGLTEADPALTRVEMVKIAQEALNQ